MWSRPSSTPVNRAPWGEIGATTLPAPDAMTSWQSINAIGLPDAIASGITAVLPVYSTYRAQVVECLLLCAHVEAANFGDVRVQLDVGPRADLEAAGAPNDAASTRTTTTIAIAAFAGDKQNDPQYISLGSFVIADADRILLVDCQRLGADGLDTFAGTLYVYGLHFVPVA